MKLNKRVVELLILGVGRGATAAYEGSASSAFALAIDSECRVLVDIGLGVTARCLTACGRIPDHVVITHNHSDHSGELPVVLSAEHAAGRRLHVISGPSVEPVIRRHRLHELRSSGTPLSAYAAFTTAHPGSSVRVDSDFELVSHPARHSEPSYGFIVRFRGAAILAFSGDSGFHQSFYEALLEAPTILVDARARGDDEHSSFAEVADFQRAHPDRRFLVIGHGETSHRAGTLRLAQPGQRIVIWEDGR